MYKGIFGCYRKEFVLGNEVMSSVKNRFFVEEFEKTMRESGIYSTTID